MYDRRDCVLDRTNSMNSLTEEQSRFRLPRLEDIDLVKDDLESLTRTPNRIPVYSCTFATCAIGFFVSGQMLFDSTELGGFGQPTVSRIVERVASNSKEFVKFPETQKESRIPLVD